MLHEEVDLDDTHLCNKCGRTIVGLENYIKHRNVPCSTPKPATATIASGPSPRIGPEQHYSSFDFGDGIKEPDHHKKLSNYAFNYDLEAHQSDPVQRPDSKTEYKNDVNYDYELGADLFFSSLELQSSSKKGGNLNASTSKLNVTPRSKGRKPTVSLSNTDPEHEQDHEDDWIPPEPDSEKLMKAVSDISGTKRVELFPLFQHESPEPSEDESDDDEDYDAPPRTHTGGKWKPENRPSSSQWHHWPDQDAHLDKSIEQEDDEDYKSFSPPPGHTKGKWVPGSKITRLEYRAPSFPSKPFDESYWCSICNRKLASRFVYERHLKSKLHLKRAQEESELERAVKPGIYSNELSKRICKPSVYLGDDFFSGNLSPEKSSTPLIPAEEKSSLTTKVKRKRKCYYTKCEICKTRLPIHLLGKHLISRYHYRRMLNHPVQCTDVILRNIHRIVLQSPFQCHPCKFYANTEEHFMAHWNSDEHEHNVSSGGKLWCSFCKFECSENLQMTNHLLDQDHQEVISVINRSVPIIIRLISPIRCEFCGDEFRYNAMLNKHHEYCNEGTPEDAIRVRQSFQNLFVCTICKASFHSNTLLLQHNQKLHRITTYYCSICEVTFATPAESSKHRKTTAHKVMSARKRQKNLVLSKVCHICKKQCPDILALKDHIRDEHPENKFSCPQCGQKFVLGQELGRHVRDKNCSFFNSTTSSSSPSSSSLNVASFVLPNVVAIPSTSRATHPATTVATTTPAENSIIPNDSIKVNMNDREAASESHLYSSRSARGPPATVAGGARTVKATGQPRDEPLSRIAPTAAAEVDESEAFGPVPAMTMMDHYSNLLPTTTAGSLPSIETHRVIVTSTHNFLLPSPSSASQPSLSAVHHPLIVLPETVTQPNTVSSNDDGNDDNIVASASTSAEIFFTMANNASENNTVYVDEIVGTTTEDSSAVSWQCKICPFSSSSQADFLYHGVLHASKMNPTATRESDMAAKLNCPLCKKLFSRTSLRLHLRQHTDERMFQCELCPMSFTRKANLKNHVVNMHVAKKQIKFEPGNHPKQSTTEPPKSAICTTCGKAFSNSKILLQHAKVHVERKSIKEFACHHENCFYIGSNAAKVRTHLLSCHSDERSFVCTEPDCDYRGKTLAQLRRHTQRHENTEKKYRCNQCDFATRIPGHLRRHLLVHSGKKPFQCPHCEYSCNNIENLRKHVISTSIHRGKFLYQCKYCPTVTESGEPFKTNFNKDYRDHLMTFHKLTTKETNQAVKIL
ncbi:uncharacterized protein LOC134213148 [Armigeres subalbatus]|uniref:uncharacterized protein LOC134213148 n=1 Tax=Armigeres subalbatus TaxID=124917 RepID=UPI002ED17ADB